MGIHCQHLVTLSVCNCAQLTDKAFNTLNVATLRDLYASNTQVNGMFLTYLLQGSAQLTSLWCESCPNLHSNLLRVLPVQNSIRFIRLGELRLTKSEWLQLATLLPGLHQLCIQDCDTVDVEVLRSFVEHCSNLFSMDIQDCPISTLEAEELKMWWVTRAGTWRKMLFVM